ncbi:ABC transporter ATP-binding protein [Ochrobactrum sp. MR28]|nr:ABC transporter ATP-binding protein [Ochrobactrum sp. MR28]MBX8818235.1 ABC transporter ATP-binding protein [Ochrobactrum sp. MR31]
MSFIEIKNVNKFYGNAQALFDVSINIEKGAFVTLLGPSGSGKTTLLKLLAGFEPLATGAIMMNGSDVSGVPTEKRNFGVVFQGYALFPHMSVFDNIAYPLRVRRMGRDEISKRVHAMLDLVQLSKFAKRKPSELSGGQQQRVALSRALVFNPDLLLLDEPMSALDKKLRVDLQEELREIHKTLGTTFINVTHDQEEAMHMSDCIAVMNNGRIEQFASAFDLYRRPTTRFVADFIGKSNLIEGEISEGKDKKGAIFKSDNIEFALPGTKHTGKVAFILRPEDACVNLEPAIDGRVSLQGTIHCSTYSGDRALYTVDLENKKQVIIYGTARTGIHADGTKVFVCFKAEESIILP